MKYASNNKISNNGSCQIMFDVNINFHYLYSKDFLLTIVPLILVPLVRYIWNLRTFPNEKDLRMPYNNIVST